MFFFLVPTTHGRAVDIEAEHDGLTCIQHCLEKEAGHARGSKHLIGFGFGNLGTSCSIWMLEGETTVNEVAEQALHAHWEADDIQEALDRTGMRGFIKFPRLLGPVAFAGGVEDEDTYFFVSTPRGTLWRAPEQVHTALEVDTYKEIIEAVAPYADIGTPGPEIVRRPPLDGALMLEGVDGLFENALYDECGYNEERATFFQDEENAAKKNLGKRQKVETVVLSDSDDE